jgi:hypothetical protein
MDDHGLTLKQLSFCNDFLRNGGNGEQAYQSAYGAAGKSSAYVFDYSAKLLKNPKVKAYLSRNSMLTDNLARDSDRVSFDEAVTSAREAYQAAMAAGNYGAAVSAGRLLAQLGGHLIERRENTDATDPDRMSDDQLASEIKRRILGHVGGDKAASH